MNKPNKPGDRKNSKFKQAKISDTDRMFLAGSEIELLREQLESLKLELLYQTQEIHELEQELIETNQELSGALKSEKSSLDEAEEFAKVILAKKLSVKEALALLIKSIYGSAVVQPLSLPVVQMPAIEYSHPEVNNPDKLDAEAKALILKSRELISGVIGFKLQLAQMKEYCQQIKVLVKAQKLPINSQSLNEDKGEREKNS